MRQHLPLGNSQVVRSGPCKRSTMQWTVNDTAGGLSSVFWGVREEGKKEKKNTEYTTQHAKDCRPLGIQRRALIRV